MTRHRAAALVLLLAALTACGEKHYYSVDMAGNTTRVDADGHPLAGESAPAPPGMSGMSGMQSPHGAAPDAPPAAGPLTGTIELDPSLHLDPARFKCVFLSARRGPSLPPDAVSRIAPVTFPMKFELGGGAAGHGSGLADADYIVVAHLDSDGDVSPAAGDVLGRSAPTRPGGAPARIVLDEVLTAESIAAQRAAAQSSAPAAPFAPFAGGGGAAPTPEDLAGPRFKGRIELAPEFAALDGKYLLFIIVRSTSTAGAPLLAKPVMAAHFPLAFDIGTENAPNKTDDMAQILAGDVKIYARLAVSGDAKGGAGDIETAPQIVKGNGPPLALRLDQRRTQ